MQWPRAVRSLLASLQLLAQSGSFGPSPIETASTLSPPDTIVFDGLIHTGEGMARDQPRTVEAMAIGAGRVVAVGTDDQIKPLAGPRTVLLDLDWRRTGTVVFPGFNDAHTHL